MATNKNLYTQIGKTFGELSELFAQLSTEDTTPDTAVTKTATKTKTVDAEPADEEAGEEVEFTQEGLNELNLSELKTLADDNEIEYTKSVKKQPLIKIILEAMEDEGEEEEEEAADVEADVEEEEEEESDTVIETEDGEIDLATMSFGKLKKLAEEYDIELEAKNKAGAIAEILAFMAEEDEEEADVEEEESDEEGEEEIDLEEMDLDELQELADELEVTLPKKKKKQSADDYVEAVRELLEEALEEEEEEDEDGEEEEEEDIAEELGLNDMTTEDLAEMLEEHELSTKGKKQALIARIVKAVEDGTIEVEEEEGE